MSYVENYKTIRAKFFPTEVKKFKIEKTKDADVLTKIVHVVARFTGQTHNDIVGSQRHPGLVEARQIIAYLAFCNYGFNASLIGRRIGKNHTTIIRAYELAIEKLRANSDFAYDVSRIRMQINKELGR